MLAALKLGFLNIMAATTTTTSGGSGAFTFTVNPSGAGAPGASGVQKLVNAVGFYALMACTLGLLIGASMWAIGNHAVNEMAASRGKVSVFVSLGAAAVIGGAGVLLGYSYNLFG